MHSSSKCGSSIGFLGRALLLTSFIGTRSTLNWQRSFTVDQHRVWSHHACTSWFRFRILHVPLHVAFVQPVLIARGSPLLRSPPFLSPLPPRGHCFLVWDRADLYDSASIVQLQQAHHDLTPRPLCGATPKPAGPVVHDLATHGGRLHVLPTYS